MKIIPAIDLIAGRAVRLRQGRFDARTDYDISPLALARRYAAEGAEQLHMVDLDGSRAGEPVHLDLISEIAAEVSIPIQVGGGLRNAQQVEALLDAGAARAVIGSLAVRQPEDLDRLLNQFGPERITLAVDVRVDAGGEPRVATAAWQQTERLMAGELIDRFTPAGLRHVLCTDIGRDGMLNGSNVELYEGLCKAHPTVELQASGGIGTLEDLHALRKTGTAAVIIGKALLEGRFTLAEALAC